MVTPGIENGLSKKKPRKKATRPLRKWLLRGLGAALLIAAVALGIVSPIGVRLWENIGLYPHVRVEAPKEPITINLNVKLDAAVGLALDQALAALDTGNVAFQPKREMVVGETEDVEVVLGIDVPPSELAALVGREVGAIIDVQELKVSDVMAAELTGGSAFDIEPTGRIEQPVSRAQPTRWSWDVTPKEGGTHELDLTFYAIVTINGREHQRRLEPVLESSIQVSVTMVERLRQIAGGVTELWGFWLVVAAIGSALIAFRKKVRAFFKRLHL